MQAAQKEPDKVRIAGTMLNQAKQPKPKLCLKQKQRIKVTETVSEAPRAWIKNARTVAAAVPPSQNSQRISMMISSSRNSRGNAISMRLKNMNSLQVVINMISPMSIVKNPNVKNLHKSNPHHDH